MPFVIRACDRVEARGEGVFRNALLQASDTSNGRIIIDRWHVDAGRSLDIAIADDELAWLQVLNGSFELAGRQLTPDHMTRLEAPFFATVTPSEKADFLLSRVPEVSRYFDPGDSAPDGLKIFDWSREPVLQSMHDDRKRIYVATKSLFNSSALKGEIVIYPPGATCPAHHHEGAEHYQFIVAGSAIATVDGQEIELHAGDILYNLENEVHWFRNEGDEELIFVEYFIPGSNKTVWVPGADICEWQPTGADIRGREPSRFIPQHAHGDQTPL
jgi:quercetin dioxygenase-like cupin family protein